MTHSDFLSGIDKAEPGGDQPQQQGWNIADIVEQWKVTEGIPVHVIEIMSNERPPRVIGEREEIAYDYDNPIATLIRNQNIQGIVPELYPMLPDLMGYLIRRGCKFKIKEKVKPNE